MDDAEPIACRHRDCGCRTRDESGYCSPYCRNVEHEAHEDTVEGEKSACSCGHADCVVAPPAGAGSDDQEGVAVSIGHRPENEPPPR